MRELEKPLQESIAPAVKELAGGKWREAVFSLVGLAGNSVAGALGGAVASGLARLIFAVMEDNAQTRMSAEARRLDEQLEQARILSGFLAAQLSARSKLDSQGTGDKDSGSR